MSQPHPGGRAAEARTCRFASWTRHERVDAEALARSRSASAHVSEPVRSVDRRSRRDRLLHVDCGFRGDRCTACRPWSVALLVVTGGAWRARRRPSATAANAIAAGRGERGESRAARRADGAETARAGSARCVDPLCGLLRPAVGLSERNSVRRSSVIGSYRFLPDRLETVPQLLARSGQPRLDRAGRDAERGGDLGVRQLRPRVRSRISRSSRRSSASAAASSRVSSAGASSAKTGSTPVRA